MSVIWHRILDDASLPDRRTATVTVGAHRGGPVLVHITADPELT